MPQHQVFIARHLAYTGGCPSSIRYLMTVPALSYILHSSGSNRKLHLSHGCELTLLNQCHMLRCFYLYSRREYLERFLLQPRKVPTSRGEKLAFIGQHMVCYSQLLRLTKMTTSPVFIDAGVDIRLRSANIHNFSSGEVHSVHTCLLYTSRCV